MSLWFAQQAEQNGNVVAPDFTQLLRDVCLQTIWEPYLPDRYLETPTTRVPPLMPQQPGLNAPPAQPHVGAPPGGGVPGAGLGSGPPRQAGRGTLERKTSPVNQSFQPYLDMQLRVRDVLQRAGPQNPVPTNSGGTDMCLSYHLKGLCNTSCARRPDHRDHTPAEDAALLAWCQVHYRPE